MSTTTTTTTSSPPSDGGTKQEMLPFGMGVLLGIILAVAVVAQLFVVGCYYLCKKKQQEIEHRDKVTSMHNAFMDAVENERRLGAENEKHGSCAGITHNNNVNHQELS